MNSWLREVLCHQLWRAQVMCLLWQVTQQEQIYRVNQVVLKAQYLYFTHFWEIPLRAKSSWSHRPTWSWEHIRCNPRLNSTVQFHPKEIQVIYSKIAHDANKGTEKWGQFGEISKNTLVIQAKNVRETICSPRCKHLQNMQPTWTWDTSCCKRQEKNRANGVPEPPRSPGRHRFWLS